MQRRDQLVSSPGEQGSSQGSDLIRLTGGLALDYSTVWAAL